jgi:hypothetical protein
MNQIKSIQLGVIAICIATVPLSLAQTPRTRTSGSNQTTTTAAPIHTGSNGNSTRAPQIGINPGNAAITGATPNIGAHTATNVRAQTGISNQAIGMTGAAMAKSGSTGNSTMAAEAGTNVATGTNTNANTKAEAQTGTAAGTGTGVKTHPQFVVETDPLPVLPSPTPSLTPIPDPTPIPSPSLGPSTSPSP